MQYHRHVFPPYTLYLANYIELVLCSISQVSPLFRWPLPAGLSDCEIKIINFFLQTCRDFAFSAPYVVISGVAIIIIRSIALNKVSSRYGCCLFGLFPVLLTQLEIKSLTNSSSNNVVNFLIHYYLRE